MQGLQEPKPTTWLHNQLTMKSMCLKCALFFFINLYKVCVAVTTAKIRQGCAWVMWRCTKSPLYQTSQVAPSRWTVLGRVTTVKGVGKYLLACCNLGVNLPVKLCSCFSKRYFLWFYRFMDVPSSISDKYFNCTNLLFIIMEIRSCSDVAWNWLHHRIITNQICLCRCD